MTTITVSRICRFWWFGFLLVGLGCSDNNALTNPTVVSEGFPTSSSQEVYSSSSVISTIPLSSSLELRSSSTNTFPSSSLESLSSSSYISRGIVVDHNHSVLEQIPTEWIETAIREIKVAYGHTSHGSQLLAGMRYLENTKGAPYLFGNTAGIQIASKPFDGPADFDLGNPNRTDWAAATRIYLDQNPDVNVVMWAWCIGVTTATEADINTYLELMNDLEMDYPAVKFVYMTGHLDGTGVNGNLHLRNQQIRDYVLQNDKILYDFADIESYNPDRDSFLEKFADDNCDYYAVNADGSRGSLAGNWCTEWQQENPNQWYEVPVAHSQALNGNLKAYAAWHLLARLAGWEGL